MENPRILTKTGTPFPLGTTWENDGVNFSIYVSQAKQVKLVLFHPSDYSKPVGLYPLFKTGEVWHIHLGENLNQYGYCYQINRKDSHYDQILDPYARMVSTTHIWGSQKPYNPLGILIKEDPFDWQNISSPKHSFNDLTIYEMHVRGFTQDSSSQCALPGTFLGLIEKIPHLVDLGVNAIELLPIQEFNENEYSLIFPDHTPILYNYWGYSSVSFFSLMNRYATSSTSSTPIQEFKTMVRELHRHGIEVIVDIALNHTAEGGQTNPGFCFRPIADKTYYMHDEKGHYRDYTGCGHTFNSNFPIVRELLLNCLRYWVTEFHIDGFRFDLASALTRNPHGKPLALPPFIEAISEDPLLAHTKLIAEPWDAGMLYQVGNFYAHKNRWSEWNGRYRDCIRRFLKGSQGQKGEFATRICGSSDMYGKNRCPAASINFITVHDGFTLHDLVSYNVKHNWDNGEHNRDGTNDNDSWNCGAEGSTDNPQILKLRQQQMRNLHLALMISQGVPMILMGDEYGHTKLGNNNSWCQDNLINWFSWDQLKHNQDFYRFYRGLIHFRNAHPLLKRKTFLTAADIQWHGSNPFDPQWEDENNLIAFTLLGKENQSSLFIVFNAKDRPQTIQLPSCPQTQRWYWVVDTSQTAPNDFNENPVHHPVQSEHSIMQPFSAIMLESF